MALGRVGGKTRRVKGHDDPAVTLPAYRRPIRQLAVTGLGHDQTTMLITNRPRLPARQAISCYARRINIEQRLAEAIQSFSLDALAGAVPHNVDLDVVLSVLAHTLCAALRRRLPGYATATPDTLQRRFLNTAGIIENNGRQTTIRLARRTTHPSCARPPCLKRSPCPGGKAGPSAISTTDRTRVDSLSKNRR
jgi:Transposase DDE domain group 1